MPRGSQAYFRLGAAKGVFKRLKVSKIESVPWNEWVGESVVKREVGDGLGRYPYR
jgi:hypothetical protein